MPWQTVSRHATDDLILDQEALDGWAPARISWAAYPTKCWKVDAEAGKFHNGMRLSIMDCAYADKFIVPRHGVGAIRPSQASEFCLDAPKNGNKDNLPPGAELLQFWLCSASPSNSTKFSIPRRGHQGFVRPQSKIGKCAEVPKGNATNGNLLQLWPCSEDQINKVFLIHWPFDCKWSEWSEWSSCSKHCKSWRSRREHAHGLDGSGSCTGTEEELRRCKSGSCGSMGGFQLV